MSFSQRQYPFDPAMGGASGGPRLVAHLQNAPVRSQPGTEPRRAPTALEQRKVAVAAFKNIPRARQATPREIDRPHRALGVEADLHGQQRVSLQMRLDRKSVV